MSQIHKIGFHFRNYIVFRIKALSHQSKGVKFGEKGIIEFSGTVTTSIPEQQLQRNNLKFVVVWRS